MASFQSSNAGRWSSMLAISNASRFTTRLYHSSRVASLSASPSSRVRPRRATRLRSRAVRAIIGAGGATSARALVAAVGRRAVPRPDDQQRRPRVLVDRADHPGHECHVYSCDGVQNRGDAALGAVILFRPWWWRRTRHQQRAARSHRRDAERSGQRNSHPVNATTAAEGFGPTIEAYAPEIHRGTAGWSNCITSGSILV